MAEIFIFCLGRISVANLKLNFNVVEGGEGRKAPKWRLYFLSLGLCLIIIEK